jgi:type II secretory pathway pseudopilin PulG
MSRVIKFRGLNAQGEFVYGLPSHDLPNSTNYYSEYSHRICWHPESGGKSNQPIKNGTLGQFTGLHDVNGVEIYEGDIVSMWCAPQATCKGVISFDDGCFMFDTKDAKPTRATAHQCVNEHCNYFTVIGNIYQNPELLGGAK